MRIAIASDHAAVALKAALADWLRVNPAAAAPQRAALEDTPATLPAEAAAIIEGWQAYPALREPRAQSLFQRLLPQLPPSTSPLATAASARRPTEPRRRHRDSRERAAEPPHEARCDASVGALSIVAFRSSAHARSSRRHSALSIGG